MATRFIIALVASVALIASCGGKKTVDEYMKLADQAIAKKDYAAALRAYDDVIANYAEDTLAVENASFSAARLAWMEMGDAPSGAKYLFRVSAKYLFDAAQRAQEQSRPLEAVAAYEMLIARDSTSPDAEKALFMKGFVLSEQVKDFERAKAVFSQFMTKYPESELYPSAKFMFETAGNDSLALAIIR